MSETFNIYCDESCHLENDRQAHMIMGAVWCPIGKIKEIGTRIKDITSEGEIEEDRTPDIRRCERIGWARDVMNNAGSAVVKRWDVMRGTDRRTCLWVEDADFFIVLSRRASYSILWTVYTVLEPHRQRKFQAQFEAFQVTQKAEAASD